MCSVGTVYKPEYTREVVHISSLYFSHFISGKMHWESGINTFFCVTTRLTVVSTACLFAPSALCTIFSPFSLTESSGKKAYVRFLKLLLKLNNNFFFSELVLAFLCFLCFFFFFLPFVVFQLARRITETRAGLTHTRGSQSISNKGSHIKWHFRYGAVFKVR